MPDGDKHPKSHGASNPKATRYAPTVASTSSATAAAVALQPDGKIVAAGSVQASGSDFALVWYRPDGTLDTTFGADGRVISDLGGTDIARAMVLQPDGEIIAGGRQSDISGFHSFILARYQPNGALDISFAGTGQVVTAVGTGGSSSIYALVLQPNGKIVAVGEATDSEGASDFAVARYHADP